MGQHRVDHREENRSDHAGADGGPQDGTFLSDAQGPDIEDDDNAEIQTRNSVHGLIAGQKALDGSHVVIGS